ncbi:MAG: DUF2877 domain-containing protein [Pseudomonadota bacterium]
MTVGDAYSLSVKEPSIWAPKIPQGVPSDLQHELATIRRVLVDTQPDTAGILSVAVNEQIKHGQNALTQWLRNTNQPIPDELIKLIGTGEGLTPAGDDYLSGVIITLHYLKRKAAADTLGQWVTEHAPGRTNDISLALLLASCTGNAIEPVHKLLCEVLTSNINASIEKLTQTVIAIGHNSGCYIIQGILHTLEHANPRLLH